MGQVIKTHTRKITFELMDEHPREGHYCVFGNETADTTIMEDVDFIFVSEIRDHESGKIVMSPDLHAPVMLKYCWRVKLSIHD